MSRKCVSSNTHHQLIYLCTISCSQVLSHLLYLMRVSERPIQRRIALALAHLCSPDDQSSIFVDRSGKYSGSLFIWAASSEFTISSVTYSICILDVAGLDCLLELLLSSDLKLQRVASVALYKLADKARSLSPVDAGPASPISQVYSAVFWYCT